MRIGIDLGGTKTEIICLNPRDGDEIYRKRVPSPQGSYSATIDTLAALVREAEQNLMQKGTVGLGIPGTVSAATGLVKNANSVWLNGHPLDKDLGAVLGRAVRVQNDANCLAVSEATDGAGAGHATVFAIIVGTGCGGGLVVNGKPISGLNGIGGEWGHNPLPFPRVMCADQTEIKRHFDGDADPLSMIAPLYAHKDPIDYFVNDMAQAEFPGPQCYCGKRGCIEGWISGTGFALDYQRVTGTKMSGKEIVAFARQGNAAAQAALGRYFDRFARAVAGVIDIFDPDIIVVGGGMSNVQEIYTEVPRLWSKYVFSDRVDTAIVPARFGDSSGVRGAAWLWQD